MRVLIVCLENWDTLSEIPFILKSAGCAVDIFCSKDSWLLSNSFYDKWIVRKNQQIEYINQIEEFLNTGYYDWIILADDAIIKQINDSHFNNQQLEKLLPISNLNYRSILSSKIGLSNFCFENKIASPAYVLYNNETDLDNIQSNIQFPVINKIDFSWGGANMFVSNDIESFKSNLHLLPLNQNTMIQEFIVGEEVPVEALFYKGELLEYMTSKILVFDKGPFSLSTKRLYYDNPDLKPLLKALGKKLGITGFANMAYIKESSSGVYHLIEIDLRPNSWMAYGKFCNRDFSKALKQVLNTDTISQNESNNDFQSIEISLFFKEVRLSFWQNDLKSVLKWIFNFKHCWQFIPLYDLKLMKRIMRELGIILKQKITNLFNH